MQLRSGKVIIYGNYIKNGNGNGNGNRKISISKWDQGWLGFFTKFIVAIHVLFDMKC